MPVENIECQIAKGQMTRYLGGDSLSPEMAVELRAHIAECPGCAETLQKKKEILQTMLSGSGGRIAVDAPATREAPEPADVPAGEPSAPQPMNRITAILLERLAKAPQSGQAVARLEDRPKASQYWKPLLYSGALALVMLGMSFVMRDPTRLFGSRLADESANPSSTTPAATGKPESAQPTGTIAPPTTPKSNPKSKTKAMTAATPGKEASRAPEMGTPQTSPGSQPAAKNKSHASSTARPKKSSTRSPRRRAAAKPSMSGIKLYDPEGNPIH